MKNHLIVGLGNPGSRYAKTRHNVGYMVLETLEEKVKDLDQNIKVALIKTDTYMNESGPAVAKLKKHQPQAELIVIHDDLDLPFGKIRVSKNSASAGHRGVESIIVAIGTKNFTRVRIGIGRPPEGVATDEYVLQNFTPEEQKKLPTIIKEAESVVEKFLANA